MSGRPRGSIGEAEGMVHVNDRRRCPRSAGDGIEGGILNSNDLRVLNISVEGAAIETTRRVELNREYVIRLRREGASCRVRAVIVWASLVSREREDGSLVPTYRAGIRFRDISPNEERLIRDWSGMAGDGGHSESESRITYCF